MKKPRTVCFGLALIGLACLTARAEPPAFLKGAVVKQASQRLPAARAAKHAPPMKAARDARTGKLVKGRALQTRGPGMADRVFDQRNLPGSPKGGSNVAYVNASSYTDPNGDTMAYLKSMSWLSRGLCVWGAPNDPFSGLPDHIAWDEYIVDLSAWPGGPNDAAEVTYFEFIPIWFNEQISPTAPQFDQMNLLFFDPNGNLQGGWGVIWNFGYDPNDPNGSYPPGYGRWIPSAYSAYCTDTGFDITTGATPDPNIPAGLNITGWVMFDWVNWYLDPNTLLPIFDPNDPTANMFCHAGHMIAGGVPNFDPNLGFGVVPDPNFPGPEETIQVGSTGSTIFKDPNDPNSPPLNQIWLWSDGVSGLDPNCFDPNDPLFPYTPEQYLCAFSKTDPNFPFINWFGIDQRSQVLTNDFPFAIYVKAACPNEDPNATPRPITCRTDLDDDCFVGPSDLTLLLANWFQNKPEFDLDCDPNTPVGAQDLTLLLAEWFNDCN